MQAEGILETFDRLTAERDEAREQVKQLLAEAESTAHEACLVLIGNHVDAGSEASHVADDTPLGVVEDT